MHCEYSSTISFEITIYNNTRNQEGEITYQTNMKTINKFDRKSHISVRHCQIITLITRS